MVPLLCCSSPAFLVLPARHFANYLEEDLGADDLEELYTKVNDRGWVGWGVGVWVVGEGH